MQHPPPPSQAASTKLSTAARAHLLAEVAALSGATLQKLWLVSATQVALQLRVPGRNFLVLVDAALALASVTEQRPAAPDGAPKSQATLRAALEGARFDGLRLEVARDAPPEAHAAALRLWFTANTGRKALLADPRASALVAAAVSSQADDPEAAKVIWSGSGAAPAWRPGQLLAPARPLGLSSLAEAGATGVPQEVPQAEAADEARRELRAQGAAALETARQAVLRRLRARLKKVERTLAAVDDDSARAAAASEDRRKAELLLPFQSKVARGAREALVPDWSQVDDEGQPAQVKVALDPALSPAENCARWLKRASRYGAARGRIDARRAEVAAAVQQLRERVAEAERAADAASLRALEGETARAGNEPPVRERPGRVAPRLPFRTFVGERGARILVGRSARDNDALTFQRARGNDLWLHARGVQGSHVVVPEPGDSPDERTLLDAALLAAWFSSARDEEQTEVSWTRKKHVRKPRGGAPGAVHYSQEKTIRLRHDPARLALLLEREDKG
jgi:predicted ribosome quality control (RQC) complex YloA/Tae2 family protein